MKSMSVRGIDPELAQKLSQAAKLQGKSVNQLVLDTMRKYFGVSKKDRYISCHDDLDHLFGRWSQKEFEEIQGKIDEERTIDPELWR